MKDNPNQENIFKQTKSFLFDLMSIQEHTDKEATIESIKADISLKGHTSWILICAIVIASLGLNANSTAVIIGAMLISPLMGPILGMALSLAMNDVDLLKRALKNFGIMVGLSVTSAFVFFYVFPLSNTSSELLARTAPDIRDVLIAFFGGLALVIARAKRGTMASVIFGVAIATALMPPLCTVGFFLSVANFKLAFGALYLFLINTFFIALATFIVLRFIKIPMVKYANSSKRRVFSRLAYLFSTLMMIPAGYTFYGVWRESKFQSEAIRFIQNNIETYKFEENGYFLKDFSKAIYNNGNPYIELVFFGDASIPQEVKTLWNNQKNTFTHLKDAELKIVNDHTNKDQSGYITELYNTSKEQLESSQSQIKLLQAKLESLNKYTQESAKFEQISKEIQANNKEIVSISFANELISDFKKTDTIPVFRFQWKKDVSNEVKKKELENLGKWLKIRLNTNKIKVAEYSEK
ncbi:MAG: TIGR00341 family protein [Bacteroidota bacterium]|nr:TIGR00341 family protein [Bacteroidota bacterium]